MSSIALKHKCFKYHSDIDHCETHWVGGKSYVLFKNAEVNQNGNRKRIFKNSNAIGERCSKQSMN